MTNVRKVFKYAVPVDDTWRDLLIPAVPQEMSRNDIFHVASPVPYDTVYFWLETQTDRVGNETRRSFRVFGTGQPVPAFAWWRGTVVASDRLVWHLFERPVTSI